MDVSETEAFRNQGTPAHMSCDALLVEKVDALMTTLPEVLRARVDRAQLLEAFQSLGAHDVWLLTAMLTHDYAELKARVGTAAPPAVLALLKSSLLTESGLDADPGYLRTTQARQSCARLSATTQKRAGPNLLLGGPGAVAHSRPMPADSDDDSGALKAESMHSGDVPSIFSLMHGLAKFEPRAYQAEAFKNGIVGWSSAYYVAYALLLTVAFALLVVPPWPHPDEGGGYEYDFLRPDVRVLELAITLLFYFFAGAAATDSAWGMCICAEWGVRSVAVPANLYERFISKLQPGVAQATKPKLEVSTTAEPTISTTAKTTISSDRGQSSEAGQEPSDRFRERLKSRKPASYIEAVQQKALRPNTIWALRCFDPRAVHAGIPALGLFWGKDGIGFSRSPSWDPFYYIDRTLQELFLATVCLIYLHAGALPAAIMFGFAVSLWHRVRTEATAIVDATFETLHEAEAERQGRAGFSTVSRDGSLSLSI